MTRLLRTLAALAASAGGAVALAPTRLPEVSALQGSEALATDVATFGLRVVATGLCAYLAAVLGAVLLTDLRLLPPALRRRIDRWTSGGLAGAVRQVVGASVLATGIVPLAPTLAHATEAPTPVMAPVEDAAPQLTPIDDPPPPTTVVPAPPVTAGPPTTAPQIVPVDEPVPAPGPEPRPPAGSPPRARPADPPGPSGDLPPAARQPSGMARQGPTVVVRPGESFWSIAEDLVTLRLGRAPSDPEVIGPWLDLIARNTHVLADPDDPDLLEAGAVLRLPPGRGPR